MKTLQRKTNPSGNGQMHLSNGASNYWWMKYENSSSLIFPAALIRENNRGWTFENYTLTGNRTTLFFSRGDYEMIES